MDLLGGSDSENSSEEDEGKAVVSNINITAANNKSAVVSKRGKKLVSLHALLPPHILEQLTKGTQEDSDDDESERPEAKPKAIRRTGTDSQSAKSGLSSLLSELSAIPSQKDTNSSTGTSNNGTPANQEKLGHAFLHSSTTVVTRKKKDAPVVDIHAPVIQSSDGDGKPSATIKQPHPPPPSPKIKMVPNKIPISRVNIPRPSSGFARNPQQPSKTLPVPPPATVPVTSNLDTANVAPRQNDYVDSSPTVNSRASRKRSRRDIEKELRAGNMNAIHGQDIIQTATAEGQLFVPEQAAETAAPGIRVAPVAMYDTKAGTDVVGANVTGGAKGKNQINHLMASAASYQANQTATQRMKSHRASAKKKYGW